MINKYVIDIELKNNNFTEFQLNSTNPAWLFFENAINISNTKETIHCFLNVFYILSKSSEFYVHPSNHSIQNKTNANSLPRDMATVAQVMTWSTKFDTANMIEVCFGGHTS